MKSELFLGMSSLWTCAWQSTIFVALGLTGSFILKNRPSRAHQVLLLSMIAAVAVPLASLLVKHYELGVFVAKPDVTHSPNEEWRLTNNDEVSGIASAENMEHNPVILRSHDAEFPRHLVALYGWITASLILGGRLLVTFLLGARLLSRAVPSDCERIEQAIRRAKVKLGIKKDVKVLRSRRVHSPVIWCWGRRPILLVPNVAGPSEMDWTGVVCHELAHDKRRDHISSLLTELMVCIFPWQLLLWLAKFRLRNLSDLACDDWVIAAGQSGTDYAESLLDLIPGDQMVFLSGITGSKKELADRIRRIVKDRCGNPRMGGMWALIVSILVTCIAFGMAFAQTRSAEPIRESEADGITQVQVIIATPEMNRLIAALSSSEWKERKQAAVTLTRMGLYAKPAIPALTNALTDEEWQVRNAAAEALTSIGPAAFPAVYPLIAALYDVEWHVRRRAAEALAAIGTESKSATPDLIIALNDEEWLVRRPAALALGAIGPAAAEAIPTLIERLEDPEWQVRHAVADALEKISIGDKSTAPQIIEALLDREWKKRQSAAQALRESLQENIS